MNGRNRTRGRSQLQRKSTIAYKDKVQIGARFGYQSITLMDRELYRDYDMPVLPVAVLALLLLVLLVFGLASLVLERGLLTCGV